MARKDSKSDDASREALSGSDIDLKAEAGNVTGTGRMKSEGSIQSRAGSGSSSKLGANKKNSANAKKKKSIRPGIVFFLILLVIVGIIVYNYLTGRVYKSAAGTLGNTAGNLYNGGLFCENGSRIYFSNPNDDYTLYSMNLNMGDFKKLYNDYARYINADENYVYYTRMNNKKEKPTQSIFVFYSTGVYRIRKNGSALGMITSEPSGSLLLYDNQLFYQQYKNNALTLFRVDIDGKNEKKLFSDDTPVVSMFDGRLYYSGKLSDQNIHYINPNGNTSVAVETKAYMPIAMEEGIFYISTENKYNIYLVDYEDKERKCIVEKPVSWYNVSSDGKFVFYNCDELEESAIYMLDREKNETVKIQDGNYKWLNIAGGHCFFFDYFTDKVYAYDYESRTLNAFDPPSND